MSRKIHSDGFCKANKFLMFFMSFVSYLHYVTAFASAFEWHNTERVCVSTHHIHLLIELLIHFYCVSFHTH